MDHAVLDARETQGVVWQCSRNHTRRSSPIVGLEKQHLFPLHLGGSHLCLVLASVVWTSTASASHPSSLCSASTTDFQSSGWPNSPCWRTTKCFLHVVSSLWPLSVAMLALTGWPGGRLARSRGPVATGHRRADFLVKVAPAGPVVSVRRTLSTE